jgi:excisionase family DNA binding protein
MQNEHLFRGDHEASPAVNVTPNEGWLSTKTSERASDSWTVLLTVKQVADRLGVGRSKVYELLDSGQLGSLKIGTARRVPLGAVAEFIDRNLKSAGPMHCVTPIDQTAARREEFRS